MGTFTKWGNTFTRWYDGAGKGRRRGFWLGFITMVVIGGALIGPTHDWLFGSSANNVRVCCDPQGTEITVARDDPRVDLNDFDATRYRICNPAT